MLNNRDKPSQPNGLRFGGDLVGLMPHDHNDPVELKRPQRFQNPAKQRPATRPMQNLGGTRPKPRAFPGGENNSSNIHH